MDRSSYHSKMSGSENRGATFRRGTVIGVNPGSFTAVVKLPDLESAQSAPIMGLYGASYGEDLTWMNNLRGAEVLLLKYNNEYFVLGTIPCQVTSTDSKVSVGVTGTDHGGACKTSYQKSEDYRNFNPNRPSDFFPGDKILRADDGAELSLLRGGLAILKGSPMAKIILGKIKDFIRIICRRAQWFSDFGEMNFTHNTDGRVGLEIKGGADFVTETHPTKAKWTVQAWVGDYPEDNLSRLFIRVNDLDNAEFVTLRMGTDGISEFEVSKDTKETIGRDSDKTIGRDNTETIEGNDTKEVHGTSDETVTGAKVVHSNGKYTMTSAIEVIIQAPKVSISS
jgi:hypothetical protein